MLGSIRNDQKEVTIVGAGISGLLAAYFLKKRKFNVEIYEKTNRVGGLIHSQSTPYGLAESAAHSFLLTEPARKLLDELDIPWVSVQNKGRFILRNEKLRRFPLSLSEALGAFFRASFKKSNLQNPNLSEWTRHHLGSAALHWLVTPFVSGIYAASPEQLQVSAAFPKLNLPSEKSLLSYLLSNRSSSKSQMIALKNGTEDLVYKLETSLRKSSIQFFLGEELQEIPENKNVILSVPAGSAGKLLRKEDPRLSEALLKIPYAPLVSITVFLERDALRKVPQGVGVLIPPQEKKKILGVLFNSSAFSERVQSSDLLSFTVMLGGTRDPSWIDAPMGTLQKTISEELDSLFGLKKDPLHLEVHRWRKAIPVYGKELQEAWKLAQTGWCHTPGKILFSNYTGTVSLRGLIETASQLSRI